MLTRPKPPSAAAPDPALLARFAAIVGEKYAITDPDAQAPYVVEMRDMFAGHTPLVVRPGSVAEVSHILRLANETGTAIVPQGGNTGLVGGQTPHGGEVLLSREGLGLVLRHGASCRDPLADAHPWYVLIELSSQMDEGLRAVMEELLADGLERSLVIDATIAGSLDQAKMFWRIRELMGEVQRHEGGSIKHDISVPVAAVPAFIAEANDAVTRLIAGARPIPFGHLGDGNIHYNVMQPVGAEKAAFLARWDEVNAVVFAVVARHGGSISAEHGIGTLKRDLLPKVKDPVAYELMRTLKRALDPKGILNPGKVLMM